MFSCKPLGKKNEMTSKLNARPLSSLLFFIAINPVNKSLVSVENEKLTSLKFKGVCGPRAKYPQAPPNQMQASQGQAAALMLQVIYLQKWTTWTLLGGISLSPNKRFYFHLTSGQLPWVTAHVGELHANSWK